MLLQAEVEQVLKDERRDPPMRLRAGSPLAAWVPGPRPTTDPRQPSVPMLAVGDRGRHVLFLRAARGGVAFEVEALFGADGLEGEQKVEALAQIQLLRTLPNEAERAQRTVAWLLGAFADERHWTRENAAREIAYIARHHPHILDASARSRLQALSMGPLTRAQRTWVGFALAELGAGGRAQLPTAAPLTPSEQWRATLERAPDPAAEGRLLLARHEEARGGHHAPAWLDLRWGWAHARPAARLALIRAVGDRGQRADVPEVRSLYAGEEDLAVREGIVRAVGLLGDPRDVPWLIERLALPDLWYAATLALARQHTAEALRALRAERTRRVEAGVDEAGVAWLDHLLSSLFLESEGLAGRTEGPRGDGGDAAR
jgi:HEAT repeat protein